MDSSLHHEILSFAATVGSPEHRERLREVSNIMLDHAGDVLGTPDNVPDDESDGEEEPGDCAELNAPEEELSVC